MSVRAKFTCEEIELNEEGGGNVKLVPVVSGSEENESFFKYTPWGEFRMGTINQSAINQFELGKEYYIDITPAE